MKDPVAEPVVALTDGPIDVAGLVAAVATIDAGAVITFLGTSRRRSRDAHQVERSVTTLWYEAYAPMAIRRMREICDEAAWKFDVEAIGCVHRTGEVPLGEASVAIVVAAAHRAAAFDASRHVIDELKRSVPVWKRERFEGGNEWVEGCRG